MAIIYLDPTSGDDGNDGLTIGAPKKTLSSAMFAADNGGTINILDGTHLLTLGINDNFSKTNVTVQSLSGNPEDCILDGQDTYAYQIRISANAQVTTWKNFTFQNLLMLASDGIIVNEQTDQTTTVENMIFKDITCVGTTSLILGSQSNFDRNIWDITQCRFLRCEAGSSRGVIWFNGSGTDDNVITINRCVFYTQSSATNVGAYAGVPFDNNTMTMKNCIVFHDNATGELVFSLGTGVGSIGTFINNCYYTTGGALTVSGADTNENNVTDDPLIVDVANGDWHLRPNSPCIDTGTIS